MSKLAAASGRLSLGAILAFAAANFPFGALGIAVAVYLPPYFAGHLGVSLAVVGGAWATVRLLDMIVDPILGLVMDRTTTRFGRYRLWTLIGAPILMVSTYALFLAPKDIGELYLIGWLLIYYLAYSIMTLGHSAWGATLSTQYHERSRVFGVVAMLGVLGAVVVLLIPIFSGALGFGTGLAVPQMGWFIILSIPLTVGLTLWRTPETDRKSTRLNSSHG